MAPSCTCCRACGATPGPITDVFAGVMPFVGVYMLAVLILLMFPQLALFIVPLR